MGFAQHQGQSQAISSAANKATSLKTAPGGALGQSAPVASGNRALPATSKPQVAVPAKPQFRALSQDLAAVRSQSLMIQPQLTMGTANNRDEQAANQVSDQVMGQMSLISGPATQQPPLKIPSSTQGGQPLETMPVTPTLAAGIEQARGHGETLPARVRKPLEQSFGSNFSQVKIHRDAQADRLNRSMQARAFTTGQDIFLRANAYQPHRPSGQALLAHELTHVIQQRNSAQTDQAASVIQRQLFVNNTQVNTLDYAWTQIQNSGVTPVSKTWTEAHKERLKLWVERKGTYSPIQWYMTGQSWTFNDWAEAATALDHHVITRTSRNKEKDLAQEARKSDKIRDDLVAAMQQIGTWITTNYPGQMAINGRNQTIWAYLENFKGQYRSWYPNGSIQSRMTNAPKQNGVSSNFVILREIYYALYQLTQSGVSAISVTPTGPRYGTAIDPNSASTHRVRIDKGAPQGETRLDDLTPNLAHPWIQSAQFASMPLGAGASNTIDRMLYMAGLAGVGKAGKTAIAWAGFVFWNKRYYKIQGYGHTFHEVMDIAHTEHGVDYTFGMYPENAPQ